MVKKVVFWMVMAGLSAGLVAAAVNRTNAKTDQGDVERAYQGRRGSEGQTLSDRALGSSGYGRGRGSGSESAALNDLDPVYAASRGNGNGQNRGAKNSAEQYDLSKQADASSSLDWVSFDGAVVKVNEDSLTLEFDDGDQILIEGRAWMYVLDSGFVVSTSDRISASGFFEDGEFKVGMLENLESGQSIVVREDSGRPLWSGRGNRAS